MLINWQESKKKKRIKVNWMSYHSKIHLNNCQLWHLTRPQTTTGRRTVSGDAVAFDSRRRCESESEWCLFLCGLVMTWRLIEDSPCLCPLTVQKINEWTTNSLRERTPVSTFQLTGRRAGRTSCLPREPLPPNQSDARTPSRRYNTGQLHYEIVILFGYLLHWTISNVTTSGNFQTTS